MLAIGTVRPASFTEALHLMPPTMPKTEWNYTKKITLTDQHPDTKAFLTFTFTTQMIAWPLTKDGPPGSAPNNKADWWPYFKERHKIGGLYWVQGHLLNHNIHGPGVPDNLVPISNTTNTNMEAIIESFAKKLLDQGEVAYYEVNAHFEGAKAMKWDQAMYTRPQTESAQQLEAVYKEDKARKINTPLEILAHPWAVRKVYGLLNSPSNPGTLLWGEQFAPTRLSWRLRKSKNWRTAPDWSPTNHTFEEVANSSHNSPDQWYNTYPSE
jgi:hypothetical protein